MNYPCLALELFNKETVSIFSSHLLRIALTNSYSIIMQSFSFSTLNTSSHFLSSMVFNAKLAVNLTEAPLYMINHSFLEAFKFPCLCLWQFDYVVCRCGSIEFI